MRNSTPATPSIQSLDRGLVILGAVGKSSRPVSLGQLTELLAIDRSSAYRLANTLRRRGFLATPGGGKDYILGPSIWRLSRQYDWSNMLATVAHEHLEALSRAINETVHLAVREGRSALFVDHVGTNHVIAVSGQIGELVPLHCTAHGKALLADFGKADLEALYGPHTLERRTKQTIVSVAELTRSCSEIRTSAFASEDGEFQEGLRCLAAPIRDRDGAVIGSVGISVPAERFPKERRPEYAALVVETAKRIGDKIGVHTSPGG